MDTNSSKPEETRNAQVYALEILVRWHKQDAGASRAATAIGTLLEVSITAIARDEAPPEKDGPSLLDVWRLEREATTRGTGSPLRSSEIKTWWEAHQNQMRQQLADHQAEWRPQLSIKPGGGRNLPTRYALLLEPFSLSAHEEAEGDAPSTPLPPGGLVYRADPAKPALWIRLLLGSKPFPINSWRGYILLAAAALDLALISLFWGGFYFAWRQPRPFTTADLAAAMLAILVTLALWHFSRPIRELTTQRVSIGNESVLSFSALHGQLRAMKEPGSRLKGRIFSVVRHWGTCPVCAGEVDLATGGRAFPDRIIGRCNDAPQEHVFTFDPVRLIGAPLRPPY